MMPPSNQIVAGSPGWTMRGPTTPQSGTSSRTWSSRGSVSGSTRVSGLSSQTYSLPRSRQRAMPTLLPPAYPRLPPLLIDLGPVAEQGAQLVGGGGGVGVVHDDDVEVEVVGGLQRRHAGDGVVGAVVVDEHDPGAAGLCGRSRSVVPWAPGHAAQCRRRGTPALRSPGPLARPPCSHGRNTTGGSVAWPQHEAAGEETSPEQGSGQQVGPLRDTVVRPTRTTPLERSLEVLWTATTPSCWWRPPSS